MALRIAIVAGEASGDFLGAGLMAEIRRRFPQARFEGIGGARMLAEGLTGFHPLEALSVMGLTEVLRHLPRLLAIRRDLLGRLQRSPPDLYIGIDAPDFNLPVERRLKAAGVPTVHYVSPTVWAWRPGRLGKLQASVDRMLCIFPFERDFFRRHDFPATFVGHPLADEIPMAPDRSAARAALGLADAGEVLAVLPGSRLSEVRRLGPVFVEVMRRLQAARPALQFVIPCAGPHLRSQLEAQLAEASGLSALLLDGRAREALTAATAALVASGTATLEAMLLKRPMVMAYRVSRLTAWIARRSVTIPYFAMPNLIAGRQVIPEFTQDAATADRITPAVRELLAAPGERAELVALFGELHASLRQGASARAADAVAAVLAERGHVPLAPQAMP